VARLVGLALAGRLRGQAAPILTALEAR